MTDPKWQFSAGVAHIYDENEHNAQRTVTDPMWQFGAGVTHMYDENEHHARTGAPYYSVTDSVREWGTFVIQINTTHSPEHRATP